MGGQFVDDGTGGGRDNNGFKRKRTDSHGDNQWPAVAGTSLADSLRVLPMALASANRLRTKPIVPMSIPGSNPYCSSESMAFYLYYFDLFDLKKTLYQFFVMNTSL